MMTSLISTYERENHRDDSLPGVIRLNDDLFFQGDGDLVHDLLRRLAYADRNQVFQEPTIMSRT